MIGLLRSAGSVTPPWLRDGQLVPSKTSWTQAVRVFARCPGPRVLATAAIAPAAVRVWLGAPSLRDLAVAVGAVAFWLVFEWCTHRFSLHMKPFTLGGRRFDSTFARRHRLHHREPWQLEETLLPLWVVLPAIPITGALWWLAMPDVRLCFTAIAVFNAMALVEEWNHYLIHTPYQPRSAFYRQVVRAHRLHHFKNENHWYCTTFPWLDRLLGTAADGRDLEKSSTCRDPLER